MSGKTLHVGKGIELPLNFVTQTAAILAMRGRGKTHLAKVIAEEMLKQNQQIIVGDPTGAWWGLTSSANGKQEGFPVVVFGGDHGVMELTPESGEVIADAVVNERISVVLDLSAIEHDAPRVRFMVRFARRLFHLNRRPVHLFLDEADEFVPQHPEREQNDMLAILKRIWQRGRIKGIGGTLISQRSAVVHKTLLSQSSMLIALQTVGPQDRAALKSWFESWGDREQIDQFTSTISNLPKHEAWFWSPELGIFTRGKARKLETFDSSATPDMDVTTGPAKRAEIDVKKLGAKIAKLAEEAKQNDPAELKKRIAALEHEKAKTGWKPVAKLEMKPEMKTVRTPFLKPATLKRVQKSTRELAGFLKDLADWQRNVSESTAALVKGLSQAGERLQADLRKAEGLSKAPRVEIVQARPQTPERRIVDVSAPGRSETQWRVGGEKRILTVLAQHGGMNDGRARVLARVNKLSSFSQYVGRLVKAGHVTRLNDMLNITDAGRRALGPVTPLPSGRELLEWWKQEVGSGGEGRIFALLLEHPTVIFTPQDLIGAFPQYTEGSIKQYIGRLANLGLAERESGGTRLAVDFAAVA